MYRVVLVDEDSSVWEQLREQDCGGAVAEGEKPRQELRPGVLFTDIRMPERDGAAMTEQLDRLRLSVAEQSSSAGSFIVNQAMSYIEKNYTGKLTLQQVADCCYVSQWHLSKLLNRYAGKNFYDILNGVRIQKAKELLTDPQLKIGQISEMVGYADSAHFARIFKKLEGMSANEYRNQL